MKATPLADSSCVLPRPEKVIVPDKDIVVPVPLDQLPYTFGTIPAAMEIVTALVRVDMSTVPIFQLFPMLTLVAAPVLSNTAVSCARGKFAKAGDPPLLAAHPVENQLCAPVRFQYTVFAAGKVMLVLPPQSPPPLVAVIAFVTAVMSRKSALDSVAPLASVRVLAVPRVLEV